MRYLTFTPQEHSHYDICFLTPALHEQDMRRLYIEPHLSGEENRILAYTLHKTGKKTPVATQREYLSQLLPVLADLSVKYLVTCDAEYFKTLTKVKKADSYLGYVLDSVEGDFKVIYCPNFRLVFYNPEKVKDEIRQAISAMRRHETQTYDDPGMDIIHAAAYPQDPEAIRVWLQRLLDMDCDLAIDIETFSLKHHTAGIGTISFAWNKHEGVAFPVDYRPIPGATEAPYGEVVFNPLVRGYLKEFFQLYLRKALYHNISFDVYVLIYQLFMDDLLDTEGLLTGLGIMLRNWDCTQLITYLATNSSSGNHLGLKPQSKEFAGNYALAEITNILNVPLDDLLRYNLVDSLCTWFVYEKHWDTVIRDDQLEFYKTIFKPAVPDVIQMQLTGLPIDRDKVLDLQFDLAWQSEEAVHKMTQNPLVQDFIFLLDHDWVIERNTTLKVKRVKLADAKSTFNPNSGPQVQRLLYTVLGLPVLDYTKTKLPATGAKTIKKLLAHTKDPEILDLLNALLDYGYVDKIITSFIPAFLQAPLASDGCYYLFGNFKLGGTVSGRLSSSDPNLQNIPASSKLSTMIKECFIAPPGWLFVGLDFSSLEDRISAVTTKDPNKIRVYTDGFDGHCLRAYSYFSENMPLIDPSSVQSINSIEDLYPTERQDSKAPTFALTYQGTFLTLMRNCGFSEELARRIEERYHALYSVSDAWVAEKIAEAGHIGHVTVAFGLRVRTPLLRQVVLGNRRTPFEAAAESRTAGNALGQSWGLLNTRAATEFMNTVRSGVYRLLVRPCAHIHDAQYYLIPDDIGILRYVNKHLVAACEWQEHPDIANDDVKLGGKLAVYFPDWSTPLKIPNQASEPEIKELAMKHHSQYCG